MEQSEIVIIKVKRGTLGRGRVVAYDGGPCCALGHILAHEHPEKLAGSSTPMAARALGLTTGEATRVTTNSDSYLGERARTTMINAALEEMRKPWRLEIVP